MTELHAQARSLIEGPLRVANPNQPPDLSRLRQANPVVDDEVVGPGEPVFWTWDTSMRVNDREVALRWYKPTKAEPQHLTVFVHGGGWVNGTLASYDSLCRSLSLRSGGGVVSIGYSLSPEARYPVALAEVQHVLGNIADLARPLMRDVQLFAAAGDSAGGNLLAGALHRLAGQTQSPVKRAVFIYPVTDASLDHESWRRIGSVYNLTEARMRWYWDQYLGEGWNQGERSAPADAVPLLSDRLHLFPQSLVLTATHDPLQDEGIAFVQRLREAGVNVQHFDVPGQIHGFLRFRRAMTDPTIGADATMERIGAFLRA